MLRPIRQGGLTARLGRSPAVFASVGLFLVFIALMSGHLYSIDGLLYFRVAERMVFDQSLVFNPPLIWGGPISNSIMPIGFSLVEIPAVMLAEWARPLRPAFSTSPYDAALLYGDPVYTLTSWVNPLLVALTGALTFRTAGRLGAPRRAAMLVAVGIVFGSPLVFYARADFAQPLATLMLLGIVALLIDVIQRRGVQPGLMTGAVALAILTRPVDGLMIAVVALVVLNLPLGAWRPLRDGRRLDMEVAIGVLASLAITFAVNVIRFGAPLDFGFQTDPFGSLRFGLVAELVSPGRGLLWYFPLLTLAPLGAWALWRRGLQHETATIVLPILMFLPIYAKWQSLGQWSWGPRYLVPLVPSAGPDIMWLRLAGSTHGASVVVCLLLLMLGVLALVRAWRVAGPMPGAAPREGA